MTWKCACGKVHEVKRGQNITCSGPGHNVFINVNRYFFNNEVEIEEIKPKHSAQASLF